MANERRFGELKSGLSLYLDRCTFLKATSAVCPEFWDELRRSVLPHWPSPSPSIHSIRRGIGHKAFRGMAPEFRAWAEHFNIANVLWLERVALLTLRAWAEHPKTSDGSGLGSSTFHAGTASEWSVDVAGSPIEPPEPLIETEAEYLERLKANGRRQYATARTLRVASGFSEKSTQPFDADRLEWLVLGRLLGWGPKAIRERLPRPTITEDVIRHFITSAEDRLGMTTKRRPGRRKSEKSNSA